MASNYIQPGDVLELTAPTGGVVSGTPAIVGGLFVVPAVTAAAGVKFNGITKGVFQLPKASGEVWVEGQGLYWDGTKLSTDPTTGQPFGFVTDAALSADVIGNAKMHGSSLTSGRPLTVRKRFTIAQVNAGATLVPAIPGIKIRMIDATATAIGGAATSVTTVDILGTLTTARKLVAFAQASLTQSTVLRAGGTGAAVLADGASFTANDAGTAITVGITGSAITVATHIDFTFTYSLE